MHIGENYYFEGGQVVDNLNIDNNKIDIADKNACVPIWEKYALTIYEAAEYFNIGEHRLRQLVKENRYADFVLWIGVKVENKRKLFEQFLDGINSL